MGSVRYRNRYMTYILLCEKAVDTKRWIVRYHIKKYQVFPNTILFDSLCSLICLRPCVDYQDLRTNLLGVAALRILFLTFIS